MSADLRGHRPLEDVVYPQFDAPEVDRKTRQLCKQVQRILCSVFGGEVADGALQTLAVDVVEPALHAGRLRVVLLAPPDAPEEAELRERLEKVHGYLRSQVAQAINRKRAPELIFEVVHLRRALE